MTEVWREVPSAPTYEVSTLGRVRRSAGVWSHGRPRMIKGCVFDTGYRYIQTTVGASSGAKRAMAVHRMVCEAFHGPAPATNSVARHLDGDRANNSAANLAWGSPKENAADRRLHGRDRLGVDHHGAKLIDEHEVLAIFVLRRRGLTGEEIAEVFGLNRSSVNRVLARTAWGHVAVPADLLLGAAEAQLAYYGRANMGAHGAGRAA